MSQNQKSEDKNKNDDPLTRALAELAICYSLGLIDTSKEGALGYKREDQYKGPLPSRAKKESM